MTSPRQAPSQIWTCVGQTISKRRGVSICAFGIVFALLLFLRHPDGVLDANFWAEDGWVWYPDAYEFGLRSLTLPHSGYLQSFPRLIALVAQPFPLLWAPTIFAVVALIVQLLPPLVLLSRRLDHAWPDVTSRVLFCMAYIVLPNSFEEFGNITNSHWYLAILAFLIIMSAPPSSRIMRIIDLSALLLCGVSGPFSLFLTPVAAAQWFRQRSAEAAYRLICVILTAGLQGALIVQTMGSTRPTAALGANFARFARIMSLQIELGVLGGSHVMSRIVQTTLWHSAVLAICLTVLGVMALLIALWRGKFVFQMFTLFGAILLTAALIDPVIGPNEPALVSIAMIPGAGQRYFLIPMLVVVGALFTLASDRQRQLRPFGVAACLVLVIGIAGDFPYPRMARTSFDAAARQFATAPIGSRMLFQVNPTGVAPMVLTKK